MYNIFRVHLFAFIYCDYTEIRIEIAIKNVSVIFAQ